MGKRKYIAEDVDDPKKSKTDTENVQNNDFEVIQPQNDSSNKKEKRSVEMSGFDIKHFRKELASKQGQTMALTQFLQVCLNPDSEVDYILEYLRVGGNSHEILRQIPQENKKNLTLATPAFHIFHLIILKVQSSLPHMITITEEACRFFLNTFVPTIEIMISENSGPRHRKIILNLLTSMVTLNSDLGIEVLSQLPLTPKSLQYIVEKPNYKEKDNVRKAFILFITSFLVDGHLPLIKALLEKQRLLPLVIPGLIQDESNDVLMFLNILKKNVIENTLISKTLKLKTFSQYVLHSIFKIFSWKGPPELSFDQMKESKPEIMELLSEIVLTLFTSHRIGLYFVDKTLGTSEANKNPNLYKALLSLKRPWENEYECKTVLQIVFKCPDLHRAIIHIVEQSFQPQHSPLWAKSVQFVIKLLNKFKAEDVVPKLSNLNSMQAVNFVRFVTLPVPILRHLQINHERDKTIQLYCIKVLVKMLQSFKKYMHILEMQDSNTILNDLKNKLEFFFPKHMPSPSLIVSLIQDVICGADSKETSQDYKIPKPDDANSLILLLDLLLLYDQIHPSFFESVEGNINMKNILDFSVNLSSDHVTLLKFKIVSLWLTLDNSAISLKNPMFKELFLIMLEVYTSDEGDTWIEAKDTLTSFFKNTKIFEADENEIHLMLYTLRNAKVSQISLVADIVEYILDNSKQLSEFVKNQHVNFEITDENSETNLDKLFNDLMRNRCTEESVVAENKIPSVFIVGCMQYIQNNKDAKKKLQHFLSVYVANLLHSNYSPELTEILIGDSKLDARAYVTQWAMKSVCLPDTIVSDGILINISKSIILNEDINLKDIFPFLDNALEEDSGIVVTEEGNYKINTTMIADKSEIFIWAKYLMFCLVKLTGLNQLTEAHVRKIITNFDCIIALSNKHHMLDVSKNIIHNMLKNSHFLKIYSALDMSKNECEILATKMILHLVSKHNDIVNNLNKKHFVLKSYQQKNCNEILKAFNKINRIKNINCDHTIRVLEIIGLSKEDDILVFNNIFSVDLNACTKDDKEPSFVLELLRVLLQKYSNPRLELSSEILKNTMKLYTDLLINTDTDIVPNLTNLENALTLYIENKPNQVNEISEENFQKFFHSNTMRKSTALLASTLLKFNAKFCNVFKQELAREDIISQRELTLPLGNGLIEHNQYIFQNKELVLQIFTEYKSNIVKFLEKPHKVGQVYINSWQFIRKLVVECMDQKDCKKIFTKSHKFEIAEITHVKLMHSVFMRICISNEGHKQEYLINYLTDMLQVILIALKDIKDDNILETIISVMANTITICNKIDGFKIQDKVAFKKIIESAIWQNFCKAVLKDALKVKTANQPNTTGPRLLSVLMNLVKLFYPTDHDDIVVLFDMVTSHSEFLNVMLSYHSSDVKSRLLEFLYVLITTNKSVMKVQQIPVYLSAYRATRSPCDRLIVTILHFYEANDQPVNDYKPYVWGDTAANFYAVRRKRTSSLWSHPTPNQVLNLFEKDIIERTVTNFPVNQKLDYYYELPKTDESLKVVLEKITQDSNLKSNAVSDNEAAIKGLILNSKYSNLFLDLRDKDLLSISHLDEDETIYDPIFLFPLLSHLLAPGSVASCFKLLRTGLLSVPVVALSSHCPRMRASAYHVLHRFCMLLETETRHKNDKLLLTDFITTLRQSLATAIIAANEDSELKDHKNPRLPAIGALYLAKALMVSTAPFDPLYKPVNNFLIAKQFVDLTVVPDFLSLFHDSEVEFSDRRTWILNIIQKGTKTITDVNVVFKTMCLKMIMDFYSTVLCDRKTKEKILNALNSIITIPRAFEILVEGYGLISWLHSIVRQIGKDDASIVREMIGFIKNMFSSMAINSFAKHYSKSIANSNVDATDIRIKNDIEFEILMILNGLLDYIDGLELEEVVSYLAAYRLVSRRTLKYLSKKQMVNIVRKCSVIVKNCEGIDLINQAVVNNESLMLSSNHINVNDLTEKDMLVRELKMLAQVYIL